MANHKSALKRVRQTKTRTKRNRFYTARIKTLRKQVLSTAEAGDAEAASAGFKNFSSAVDRAMKKGVIHANKAANLKSRTAIALKKAATAPAS